MYEPSFENKHRWKAGPLTFVDEKQLIRIAEETFKNSTASQHLFPVSQNLLYFILFYFCHAFPLCVWRPYCQVIPRVRRWHKLQEIVLNSLFFVMIRKTVFTCKIGRLIQWVFYCSSMTWRWPTPERSKVSFLKKKKKKNI